MFFAIPFQRPSHAAAPVRSFRVTARIPREGQVAAAAGVLLLLRGCWERCPESRSWQAASQLLKHLHAPYLISDLERAQDCKRTAVGYLRIYRPGVLTTFDLFKDHLLTPQMVLAILLRRF